MREYNKREKRSVNNLGSENNNQGDTFNNLFNIHGWSFLAGPE